MTPANDPSIAPRVLVIEDESKTRRSLVEGLELEGWQIAAASSGMEAAAALRERAFDLVILDWMLPDRDGIDLLRELRQRGANCPVLVLTARTSLNDRVIGLDSGADDYLAKPFAFAELVARCRALMRRQTASNERLLTCGDLQLDTRARVARRAGQEIALTPREVDVLEYLLRHQGEDVTREMLEREVWRQPRRMTSLDNVIDVQMMRLRRKIDAEGQRRLIHTIRGIGFRLEEERP
jgi:two-component system, OmpR family, copper resistance phosphate regulon response regulator CusR